MSLRPVELAAVAEELARDLAGAVVQKVHAPAPGRVYLEVRVPGRSDTLHLCAAQKVGRLSLVDQRPAGRPGEASGFQHVARTALTGAKLTAVTATGQRATLQLLRDDKPYALHLELSAPPIVLLTSGDRVLAVSGEGPERPGALFVPRASAAEPGQRRLTGASPARAAELLLATEEATRALADARAPLLTKLKRLKRTREKVQADVDRTSQAARFRQDGELLKQHLNEVPKGAKTVTFDEYLPDGTIAPRTLTLDPARSAAKHAEWLFHQYKRFTRGADVARRRLADLDAEQAALERALEAPPPAEPPRPARPGQGERVPFREYLGADGHRLWVGKGSADNDTLTFKHARPHHLWLHARGVPGAHVVVPLERGASAPQELLLDAAHLALHHSDLKGQPRGEVSYVAVKHVRKVKGAPGAVTFSQEKTFVLRVEPDRLKRLLATER